MESPNIEPPYKIYGGIYRAEAIMLLRRFYVQENEKGLCLLYIFDILSPSLTRISAPEPKQKKNRELKTDIMPLVNMKNPEG
jgi:tRNA-specific adenosine deaminase 2